jgi:hypothetical protein
MGSQLVEPCEIAPAGTRAPMNRTDRHAGLRRLLPHLPECLGDADPVYALPQLVIDALARRSRLGCPLFDARAARAESTFTTFCEQTGSVGWWSGLPVQFTVLDAVRARIPAEVLARLGWARYETIIHALLGRCDRIRERLRGIVGWLLTEPTFLQELAEVRCLFEKLPLGERPWFPLGRLLVAHEDTPEVPLCAFGDALGQLLDRWELVGLASWDLPIPQGPLMPNMLPTDALAQPRGGVQLHVPTGFPLEGDDNLHAQIVQAQHREAMRAELDESRAGTPRSVVYGRMFQLIHLERAVRSRFDTAPAGLVGRIETAATDVLGLSLERVQRLRKIVSACRRGRRASVRELRVAHC